MGDFRILLVDDEPDIVESISRYFKKDYDMDCFTSSLQALESMKGRHYAVAIIDYKMPELNGLELFIEAKKINAYTCGILFTAWADKNLLGEILNKELIFRYVDKPLEFELLGSALEEAMQYCNQERKKKEELLAMQLKCEELQNAIDAGYDRIIGIDKGLKAAYSRAEQVARYPVSVLLTGETGTGKELFAHAIHRMSPWKDGMFIPINCGALPGDLIESELFGYTKGAFTGALKDKPGKIELAHNGTLFLDEVAELKPGLQVKLLRVLQDKKIERLGSNQPRSVNFRLIAATNKDLQQLMRKQQFREDLYFRLNEVAIHLPALRERREDMEALLIYFTRKYSRELNLPLPEVSDGIVKVLAGHSWKGNIREFSHAVKQVMIFSQVKSKMSPDDFAFLFNPFVEPGNSDTSLISCLARKIIEREIDIRDIKSLLLREILNFYNGHIATAVANTGIKRDQFYKLIANGDGTCRE